MFDYTYTMFSCKDQQDLEILYYLIALNKTIIPLALVGYETIGL